LRKGVFVGAFGRCDFHDCAIVAGGHLNFHQRVFLLSAIELVHVELHGVALDLAIAPDNANGTNAGGTGNLDEDLSRGHAQHITEFLGKYSRQVDTGFHEVVIAVAGLGHLRHQVFVEAGADAYRRDRDAFLQEPGAQPGQVSRRTGAHVGQSVGEKNEAVGVRSGNILSQFGCSLADAAEKSGVSAGLDAVNTAFHPLGKTGALSGNKRIDFMGINHKREDVVPVEAAKGFHCRFARFLDLIAGHGSGPVQHDTQVDRGPFHLLVWGRPV